MSPTPVYTFEECMELMSGCRLDELVALSSLLIEEWKSYTVSEQIALLSELVKRRKELYRQQERNYLFIRGKK